MKTILQINSSIYNGKGESSKLAAEFVAGLRRQNPGAQLVVRDLAGDPVPHLDAERFGAFLTSGEKRSERQKEIVQYSDALIDELRRADVIVLGMPMYNFGVPSQLKAWIDHIARAGVTFRYTEKGPVGLLTGKRAYIVTTRGGLYAGTASDHQTPYIRQLLGFLGITDVEIVYAEGLAMGPEAKQAGLAAARLIIDNLFEPAQAAA